MIKQLINHIVFVLDASGSMSSISDKVIKAFNAQVQYLAKRSKELLQETRVSIYSFNDDAECLVYDKDVLRLPDISDVYRASGQTALIDAMLLSIRDLSKIPELYGDNSYLLFCLTDGCENNSNANPSELKQKINSLNENWTVAILVPDQSGVFEAKKAGFPAENISIWNTDAKGVDEMERVIRETTNTYMTSRASGIRGTKSLFKLNVNLSTKEIRNKLNELKSNEYELLSVHKDSPISDFVKGWMGDYRKGSAYYQLTKPEMVQSYKQLVIENKANGKIYSGYNARKLLNLPDYELKVSPGDFNEYEVFIQSTSANRRLIKGTKLVVLK